MSRLSIGRLLRAIPVIGARVGEILQRRLLPIAYPGVRLGQKVMISWSSRVQATDGGRIVLEDGVSLASGVLIQTRGGKVQIGPRSFVGRGSIVAGLVSVEIGADALIAEYVTIRDQDHDFEGRHPTARRDTIGTPIKIGENVWIGAKATILKGVVIGENAVIGANAVVTKDVPANAVAVGVPARVVRILVRAGACGANSPDSEDHP